MAVVATFLVNLLCSIVSCDARLPGPEIGDQDFGGIRSASSSIFSRTTAAVVNKQPDLLPDPIVVTKYGQLRGYAMRTAGNRRILAFEGIPYAQPPIGWGRFRAPTPPSPWDGVKDAKKPGSECLQLSLPRLFRVVGSEDCLYLNIYTPSNIPLGGWHIPRTGLPIVMLIHGGSYYFGEGHELGPSYLLDKDVILVTFNYRLGVLGFMSSGDHHSPGNNGLKDQSMAIRWIYENIASFGGDPSRITLLGQNSGGACAHMHLLSNNTAAYISSGASLSGSAFAHWAFKSPKESRRLTLSLAKVVSCPADSSETLVTCMRLKNPVELVAAQNSLLEFSPFPTTLFSPVIEPPSPEAFLTKKPEDSYTAGDVLGKPWIFSHVSQEGYLGLLMLKSYVTEGNLRSRWGELAPIYLDYKHTSKNVTDTTAKLSKFYFGYKTPKNVGESKIATVFGDRMTLLGVHKAIQAHSRIAPTYAYIFGFKGKYTLGRVLGKKPSEWGVGSGEDLYYYFNSSTNLPGFKKADLEELSMSNVMTTFLSNFAATGEPFLPQENGVYTGLWEPARFPSFKFLQLHREIKMIPQPFKKRIHFWTRLAKSDPSLLDPLFDVH